MNARPPPEAPPPVPDLDAYKATRRFGALDGLRAFAAAAVVWHHCGDSSGVFGRSVGVTTFFVMSGLLITRLLLRQRERAGTVDVGSFVLGRALRTFPLYYAVLAAYVALVWRFERGTPAGTSFFGSLPYFLSFTANWFVSRDPGERVIFYFAWSIALQEQFYLLWPLVLRFVRRRHAVAIPLALLCLEDLHGLAAWAGWHHDGGAGLLHRILVGLDSPLFLGVVAAFVLEHPTGHALARRVAGQLWSLPLAVGLVLSPFAVPGLPQGVFEAFVAYLVVACTLAPAAVGRLVGTRVARHVGTVSFGVYLLHMLAVNLARRLAPGHGSLVVFGMAFPLTVAMASASYRWFEAPILRLRDRLPSLPPAPEAV